jgi:V/A-type H+/Na+-transporting ATPase subunit I
MALRARAARWFELLTAREDLAAVLRCLATTGAVELESHTDVSAAHVLPQLRAALDEYRQLAQRYAQYWPAPADASAGPPQPHRAPEQLGDAALKQLRAWAATAEPLVGRLRQLAVERAELAPLEQLLSRPELPLPDLALFTAAGPVLASRAYALAPETGALAIPPSVLVERVEGGARSFLLALGIREQISAFDDHLSALKARRIRLPRELPAGRAAALEWIASRGKAIDEESGQLQRELQKLDATLDIGAALGSIAFIEWLVSHVPELTVTENFAWVTGWTSDASGAVIEGALRRADLQYLLRFAEAPQGLSRPVVLRNPAWLRPFELFSRLLGVPAEGDADPSLFVALLAPLMFGFMFGDVGQGAVLIVTGLALKRRYPALALLVPGGAAAVAFGFAFGSVFGRDDLLRPLWLRPIDHPLTLLVMSLEFGACVITAGLLLEAVQYFWGGHARLWWRTRAGLLVSYLSVLGAALGRPTLWALPAGLLWFWVGSAAGAPAARWRAFGSAAGESIETLLQLLVNTISFVRVGAFALAHAGLAAAIGGIVAGIDARPLAWLALAVGNLVVICIEGLVVGIQTTRLILFEFFIRFLKAAGRPFRPLPPPETRGTSP